MRITNKDIFNTLITLVLLLVIYFLHSILFLIQDIQDTVDDTQIIIQESLQDLASEGKDYIIKEYSDDAKDLSKETIDSLKNRTKRIFMLENK